MKKAISIAAIIVGALVLLSVIAPVIVGAILLKAQVSSSIGIIGGADGPTAIMVAGTLGTGGLIAGIAVGILLVAAGIFGLVKIKKKG